MTQTGRCLCGKISYELTGDVIATAVCHCDHCQRQSGGAFSVNLIAMENQLTVSGDLNTFEDRGENDDAVYVSFECQQLLEMAYRQVHALMISSNAFLFLDCITPNTLV